jgi:Fe-S-cluster containining protein
VSVSLPIVRDSFERPDLCGPCGGACCARAPGEGFPEDFGAPDRDVVRNRLLDRFRSGRWSFDWWEGDPRDDGGGDALSLSYYPRPSTIKKVGAVTDPSWGGACTFLGEKGCTDFENRPTGCRSLQPMPPDKPGATHGECRTVYGGKREAAIAWIPYQDIIEDIIPILIEERSRRAP